jgi:hypothetical protein
MKLRPQIQLRFRDLDQFQQWKERARKTALSFNEWILQSLENQCKETHLLVRKGEQRTTGDLGNGKDKRQGQGRDKGAGTLSSATGKAGASAGVGEKSPTPSKRCETHNKAMQDYGNAWYCEGPPRHKVMK